MRTPGFGLSRRSSTSGVLPIAWTMSPYFPPQGLLSRRGSSTSESVVPLTRAYALRLLGEHRVLVRVCGCAAAEELKRLGAGVPELVAGAGRDHHRVARGYLALVVAEPHPAASVREEVDLLGRAVVVLLGLAAWWHGRFRQALVLCVPGRDAGQLPDLRAVLRGEGLQALELLDPHRSEATAVADLEQVRPDLLGLLRSVAREAVSLVEAVGAIVRGEGPNDRLLAAALSQRVQRAGEQRPADSTAPATGGHEQAAHLAHRRVRVVVSALSAGAEAQELPVLFGHQDRHGGVLDQHVPALGVRLGELVSRREQVGECGAGRLVPHARTGGLVASLGEPDDQRLPPAIAGRMTTVSLSDTPVSSPWSTRTSSSFR